MIFKYLQSKATVQIWLFENTDLRYEGIIQGFDEFMNLVLDETFECSAKHKTKKPLGRMMLKGDNISLIAAATAAAE